MSEIVEVDKNEDAELPVPTVWRSVFFEIVEALQRDNFTVAGVPSVDPLTAEEAENLSRSIASYGVRLRNLPEETWKASITRWMGHYWEVLIDLFSEEEGEVI